MTFTSHYGLETYLLFAKDPTFDRTFVCSRDGEEYSEFKASKLMKTDNLPERGPANKLIHFEVEYLRKDISKDIVLIDMGRYPCIRLT